MEVKKSILIIEDDKSIRNFISATVEINGYNCYSAATGEEGLNIIEKNKPEVVILDLGLPDMDGIEIIKKITYLESISIIVLSARTEDKDKIIALDLGAEDYLTKPFSIDELLARIRVAFRKKGIRTTKNDIFENGELTIDFKANAVFFKSKELHLTPIEYKILILLAQNIGKVLTHNFILKNVWGDIYESDKLSLRVFMANLRKKLKLSEGDFQYIQTYVSVGYKMNKYC